MARWDKIAALEYSTNHLVDWGDLCLATKKAPRPLPRWAARFSAKQVPIGTIMSK